MENLGKKLSLSHEKIGFVGIGTQLKSNFIQLRQILGRKPDFLFDRDSSRWDQDFFGVPCFGMDELTALPKSSILIITVRDYQEIAAALVQNNFENIYLSFFERAEWRLKEIRHLSEFNSKLTHVDPRISELSNKTCYVSGATGGVGTQIALHMAEAGSSLLLHGRSQKKLDCLAEQVTAKGARVKTLKSDFLVDSDLEEHCKWLESFPHKIDFFYLNAGISPPPQHGSLLDGSIGGWEDTLKVNLIAPWAILRSIQARVVRKEGPVRCFLTTSSINKEIHSQAYACSKAALDKMMLDSNQAMRDLKLQICVVDPGWVNTNMGGSDAPFSASSVIPGAVFATHSDYSISGSVIVAQDYRGLSVDQAIKKGVVIGDLHDQW